MKKSTLFLLLFGLGFIHHASAQNKTVVYGNLGVENVNISIVFSHAEYTELQEANRTFLLHSFSLL